MEPTVERVADMVAEMLARPWPTDSEDLRGWLRWHHLEGAASENGASAPLPDWPGASGGLTHHEGRFVGLALFLWHDADPIEVVERFRRLSAAFDVLCGQAVERWGPTGQPAALWRDRTHTIELYAHTVTAPCVQFQISDTTLAQAQEAEARAKHEATTHPLAAVATPADGASFRAVLEDLDQET